MSSSTTCSVVDDYAVMFNGALYIRKVNKDATPEEKKQRRAQYMKRYRSGRKAVKKEGAQKEEQGFGIIGNDDTEGAHGDGEKAVGDEINDSAQPCVETGSARE